MKLKYLFFLSFLLFSSCFESGGGSTNNQTPSNSSGNTPSPQPSPTPSDPSPQVSLSYDSSSFSLYSNYYIKISPTVSSFAGTVSYSNAGQLPSGITLNASTGVIEGSTYQSSGSYNTTITATDGNSSANYAITFNLNSGGNIRISYNSNLGEGNNDSSLGYSLDGRKFYFCSFATNILSPDAVTGLDCYVRDLFTNSFSRLATLPNGTEINPGLVAVSANGSHIGFITSNNLVDGGNGFSGMLYIKKINNNSYTFGGYQSNGIDPAWASPTSGYYSDMSISSNSSYIVFRSSIKSLVAGKNSATYDIFLTKPSTRENTLITKGLLNSDSNGNSIQPIISSQANKVIFSSQASNLVSNDSNSLQDCFIFTISSNSLIRIMGDGATQLDASCTTTSISGDGRYVTFETAATNVKAGIGNGQIQVFLYDSSTGNITFISENKTGNSIQNQGSNSKISDDGKYIVFTSSGYLTATDTSAYVDLYVYRLSDSSLVKADFAYDGSDLNGSIESPNITADGRTILFLTGATNVISNDINGKKDLFSMPNPLFQ